MRSSLYISGNYYGSDRRLTAVIAVQNSCRAIITTPRTGKKIYFFSNFKDFNTLAPA